MLQRCRQWPPYLSSHVQRANDQPKTPMGLCVFKYSIAIIILITVAMLSLLTGTHEKFTDLTFVRIGGSC